MGEPATPPPRRGWRTGAVLAITTAALAAGCVGGCVTGAVMFSDSPTTTDRFMRVLDDDGIRISEATAVELAHQVCDALDRKPDMTKADVVLVTAIHQNLAPKKAGTFVGAAIGAYCPEYDDRPW